MVDACVDKEVACCGTDCVTAACLVLCRCHAGTDQIACCAIANVCDSHMGGSLKCDFYIQFSTENFTHGWTTIVIHISQHLLDTVTHVCG